ncbi:hypothetical protein SDC9_197805 [bioreactor metagenome]|uniref:Uncharacterized protein n=1 Tax=bioreactor metagenome TaxID=1076179 RepID=A0A645II72_9ZZZZ
MNKDINWLNKKLKENNIKDPKDIFIAILYSNSEKLYFQHKDNSYAEYKKGKTQ